MVFASSEDQSLRHSLSQMRSGFQQVNSAICNAKSDKNDRFFVQGMYDGALLTNHADGHICVGDDVAVLYEYTPGKGGKPAAKAKRTAIVEYGQVQSMSWFVNKKERAVFKVHLEEEKASLVCKWYRRLKESDGSDKQLHGTSAWRLPMNEIEGYNIECTMPSVLSAIRMMPCPEHKCCLLHPDDEVYAKQQLQRYMKHINQSAAQLKKNPDFAKCPRPNHDQLKLQREF